MAMDSLLIDYLPPFMQEYEEVKQIMGSEQPEFDALWNECEKVLNNQFIMDASEKGVERWERMLKITPKDTDTLDERKFRILARMKQELPYNIRKLEETLVLLCGEGNFYIDLQPSVYRIEIKLALSNKSNYEEVVDLLSKMIPANMVQWVQVMYNSYSVIGQFKHAELTAFSHEQIRNEAFN